MRSDCAGGCRGHIAVLHEGRFRGIGASNLLGDGLSCRGHRRVLRVVGFRQPQSPRLQFRNDFLGVVLTDYAPQREN
jgi:hypothetical protein